MDKALMVFSLFVGLVVALLAPVGWEWCGGVIAVLGLVLAIWHGNRDNPLW